MPAEGRGVVGEQSSRRRRHRVSDLDRTHTRTHDFRETHSLGSRSTSLANTDRSECTKRNNQLDRHMLCTDLDVIRLHGWRPPHDEIANQRLAITDDNAILANHLYEH